MQKGLRVTVRSSIEPVHNNAYARFTFQSRKSQITDSKDTVCGEEKPEPKVPQQTKLRKTNHAPEKTRPKLGLDPFQGFNPSSA
jgi:hypothetical protein